MPRATPPAGAFTRLWGPPLLLLVLLLLWKGTAQVAAARLLPSEVGGGRSSGFLQLSSEHNPGTSPGLTGRDRSANQGFGSSGGGGGGTPRRVLPQSPPPYLTGSALVKEAETAFGIPLADKHAQPNGTDTSTPLPAGKEKRLQAGRVALRHSAGPLPSDKSC